MKNYKDLKDSLNKIREAIDTDIIDVDIDQQKNKLIALTQLIGLSAECNASAKIMLYQKELEVLQKLDHVASPTRINKELSAQCYEEKAILEYADRLNAGMVHAIDSIRSIISLYKVELENSLKS